MGIRFIDQRPAKQAAFTAIDTYKRMLADGAFGDHALEVLEGEITEFTDSIRIGDRSKYVGQVMHIARASPDRAKKLVEVIDDVVLRAWIRWPILILMWPFIFIVRVIRLGIPR